MVASGVATAMLILRLKTMSRNFYSKLMYIYLNNTAKQQLNLLNMSKAGLIMLNAVTFFSSFCLSGVHWATGVKERYFVPLTAEEEHLPTLHKRSLARYHEILKN